MDAQKALEILVRAIPVEKQTETTSDAGGYLAAYIASHGDNTPGDGSMTDYQRGYFEAEMMFRITGE
jgi:hypothetical protein